jgi:hypothetical protein
MSDVMLTDTIRMIPTLSPPPPTDLNEYTAWAEEGCPICHERINSGEPAVLMDEDSELEGVLTYTEIWHPTCLLGTSDSIIEKLWMPALKSWIENGHPLPMTITLHYYKDEGEIWR